MFISVIGFCPDKDLVMLRIVRRVVNYQELLMILLFQQVLILVLELMFMAISQDVLMSDND